MSDQPEQPVRIHDFERLQMWTPTPGAAGKRAKLSFGIRDGNPRITVFTNDPNDKISSGVIYAAMNPETFYMFLKLFGDVVNAKEEVKYKIQCFGTRWENDKPTKDKLLISDLCFGRDAEGMVWICLIADNRPKIKFEFNISDYHLLLDGEGKQFDKPRASRLEAAAKLALLHQVYGIAITKNLENPTPRPNKDARGGFKKADTSFSKPADKSTADLLDDIGF